MRAVERAHALQTPDDVGQIAAENAAVGVDFVDDDVFEVFKQLDPLGVMGQYARVEHIRIGHHHMAGGADGGAGGRGGVAVVGIALDRLAQEVYERVQLGGLIGGERLCGEEIEGARVGILEDRVQHGQIVAQGLAGGRGRDHNDVLALKRRRHRLMLMAVQLMNAALVHRLNHARIERIGERLIARGAGRHLLPAGDVPHEGRVAPEHLYILTKIHGAPPHKSNDTYIIHPPIRTWR